MGTFLHILLCSAAAIGGHYAVGLTSPSHSGAKSGASGTYRFVEPGLMAVPIVRHSDMQGLAFLKLGLSVDAALPLDEAALNTLIADALYDAVIPVPSSTEGSGPFDMTSLDLNAVRETVAGRLNEMTGMEAVQGGDAAAAGHAWKRRIAFAHSRRADRRLKGPIPRH